MAAAAPKQTLEDPPSLLAIANAAHRVGDRDLERAARRLLREQFGIEVSFAPTTKNSNEVQEVTRA
jgi:hypothetical protein